MRIYGQVVRVRMPTSSVTSDVTLRTRPRVLIVEDDPTNAALVRELLIDEGYAVEVVTRGVDALARCRAGQIDLMLLDLKLPDVDGLTICRRLRAREAEEQAGRHLPIIVLTARENRDTPTACLLAGADAFIRKPFDVDTLLGYVGQWVNELALT
jgi:CheY-like chemotaxis protein